MEDENLEAPRRQSLWLWPVRILLRWVIKSLLLVVLSIRDLLRPRPVRFGLAALLLVGVLGWNYAGGVAQGPRAAASVPTDVVSTAATRQLPPHAVVELYLKAQATFDANGMWETISDDMKQQMGASDASRQQLQAQLDAARQQGRRYAGATYVGGVSMDEGRTVYFYVLKVDTPNGSVQVPYIYVVGPDDKIVSIQ